MAHTPASESPETAVFSVSAPQTIYKDLLCFSFRSLPTNNYNIMKINDWNNEVERKDMQNACLGF